eukprot:scaffold366476_cov30-Prasinocladus_malaysianus.AAC.1
MKFCLVKAVAVAAQVRRHVVILNLRCSGPAPYISLLVRCVTVLVPARAYCRYGTYATHDRNNAYGPTVLRQCMHEYRTRTVRPPRSTVATT